MSLAQIISGNVDFGTVTATSGGTTAVSNSSVTANSLIILTYKSGTTATPGAFVSAVTPGTGFSITAGTGDSAIYNYMIIN